MAFLSISVLLLIALLARLGDWQLRFKILIWLIVGGFLYEIAGFFIVLAGIPLGGLMLDEAPWALAFVLFCLHVYPPKPMPRRQDHDHWCEQCGAGVKADALRCTNCPAVFTNNSRWRVMSRRNS